MGRQLGSARRLAVATRTAGQGERQVGRRVRHRRHAALGRRYRDEEMHLWTLGAGGKVVRLRPYTDTAEHIAAAP